jgi:integrase
VVRHQPALPYAKIPALMTDLARLNSVSARALAFTLLTATRTNQVVGMEWKELDLEAKLWVCPKERMKGKKSKRREHRIPLGDAALAIVEEMKRVRVSKYVFPGQKRSEPLSNMAMLECLRGLRPGFTVHGTARSGFKDWAAECTSFPYIVSEAALGHVVADKTEASYRRGDLFDKRRELMAEWADYCCGKASRPVDKSTHEMRSAQS